MKKGSPESEKGSGDLFIYSVRVPDIQINGEIRYICTSIDVVYMIQLKKCEKSIFV